MRPPTTTAADPENLKVPQSTVDELLALPGVEGGAGILTGSVAFLGTDGQPFATSAVGRLWVADHDLNPLSVTDGDAPTSAGEIAVDRGTAGDHELEVGDDLTLLTLAGKQKVTLVGITEFGDSAALDSDGTVSITEDDAFDWLNSGQAEYESYYLRGSGDPDDLVAAAGKVLPDGFEVQTGDQFRADQRATTGSFAQG